uniref:Alpha-soluble NSF attachment protein n=1 Tax=Bicosoecida sp. CB-2014 TaxID=1486930 RepID=A0A7S1GAW4_9STRA|mmetsp:Transcript_25960/g.90365  ORF Transcript_25960/g.90365 Transcript_25960/m.90365 type:complete len:291 (+) Transcript_25960:219-1091(+)|eukprot:CAMPEP_0203813784 /NCGR_PEP_ID=MMETSP0115-20131106/4916_1 /ASSEMBLY_ACC=CAM_ASM_000227 /TAXON_ID=33651 /ORGANISM="Bicosoecid sp, Strain ms1" /LENGTH=290 /DNA_ID=CAMNT_0050722663 /DNA_START=219 /DNA_END=1091 /DNA_ORIENTATION=+
MASESKGDAYMADGEKALKRFSLFGAGSKFEDAGEAFLRAGNAYKVAKNWEQAAKAFQRCAECEMKTDSAHEAATHVLEAAKCLKKVNVSEAIELYLRVITQYEEMGKFSAAAKLEKEVAELYEGEHEEDKCIQHYQRAADLFAGENAVSSANGCLTKVAHYQALAEHYEEAIAVFEEIGQAFVENEMMKFKARTVFLQAGLCHLAQGDPVAAERAIARYREIDYTFADAREAKLLENVHAAYVAFDVDAFTDHVASYDSVSKLTPWMTTILLRIKEAIKAAGESAVDLS